MHKLNQFGCKATRRRDPKTVDLPRTWARDASPSRAHAEDRGFPDEHETDYHETDYIVRQYTIVAATQFPQTTVKDPYGARFRSCLTKPTISNKVMP